MVVALWRDFRITERLSESKHLFDPPLDNEHPFWFDDFRTRVRGTDPTSGRKAVEMVAVLAPKPIVRPMRPLPMLRSRRPIAAVYFVRRLIAAVVLFSLLVGVSLVAHVALERIGGGPLAATDAASASGLFGTAIPAAATSKVWVVRPGDTLWNIAVALDPHGDVRPLVDRLAAEVGDSPLYPGEEIQIPTPAR